MERLTNRANKPSGPQGESPRRSSLFVRVAATIIAAILIGGAVAAVVVGLLTFAIALLLIVPIAILLLIFATVAGRGKLTVYVQRSESAGVPRRTDQSPHDK